MNETRHGAGPTRIPLTPITTDPTIQPRQGGLDQDHVAALTESGPDSWPPLVVVARDSYHYLLVDGWHRLAAAEALKLETVECDVHPGREDGDLSALAFSLNRGHGKPLTLADRKAEARRLLCGGSDASNSDLAAQCGLSDKTVGAIRQELEATSEIPKLATRRGKDGKVRTASPRQANQAADDGPEAEVRSGCDGPTTRGRVQRRRINVTQPPSQEPAMSQLLDIVNRLQEFLVNHAGDELGVYLAEAITKRCTAPERAEAAETMRVLSEQLIAAAQIVEQRPDPLPITTTQINRAPESPDSSDEEQAA